MNFPSPLVALILKMLLLLILIFWGPCPLWAIPGDCKGFRLMELLLEWAGGEGRRRPRSPRISGN